MSCRKENELKRCSWFGDMAGVREYEGRKSNSKSYYFLYTLHQLTCTLIRPYVDKVIKCTVYVMQHQLYIKPAATQPRN